MIDQEYTGTGLMTEFVENICLFAFEILNILKIYAIASEQNPASRKVLLKCGFKEEGYLSHEYRSGSGKLENVYRFALFNDKMMNSPIQPKY
jgi:RimJ/RimL family protein N-acetyltransferase